MRALVEHVLTSKAAQQSDAPVSLEEAVEAVAQPDIEERETTHGWGHGPGDIGGFGELTIARSRLRRSGAPLTEQEYTAFRNAVIRYEDQRRRR